MASLSYREKIVLHLVDEALHQVALFVQMSIVLPRHLPVGAGRDDGDRATLSDYLDECVGVVPLIGNHILYGVRQEQRLSLGDIMGLACRELELERVAQGVHAHVDFTGEATATSAQALRPLAPFLAARRPHRDGPGSWCCPAEGVPGQDHWQRPLASASRRLAHTSGESVYTRCSIGHTPAGAPATGHRSGISTRSP